ncbi:RES family NAD+ phosphorylase [Niveispirillum irakense]|uniref:RES family NAD+ phosphorylase n=1 Tax=Niveispirillum irakense TaxID=34011 RepID=UPI001FE1FEBA|nr:RES domain-containing protein [Niveispirillum irakense]
MKQHWAGVVYRAHHPRWAFAPDSGEGAARFGGRFNPLGTPALYTALRLQGAWTEAQQGFPFKAQPMTLMAYQVDCADMVDLTDAAILAALGVTGADLACAWEDVADRGQEPPSWALARRLIGEGCAGILAPSFAAGAQPGDVNAIFWRWSPVPPHQVQVVDDAGRLPRDDASWR